MLKKLVFIIVYGGALLTVFPVAYICSAVYWAANAGWYASGEHLWAYFKRGKK